MLIQILKCEKTLQELEGGNYADEKEAMNSINKEWA